MLNTGYAKAYDQRIGKVRLCYVRNEKHFAEVIETINSDNNLVLFEAYLNQPKPKKKLLEIITKIERKNHMEEININGVVYVRKDEALKNAMAEDLNGMPYCMVRTYSAGVFAGYIKKREGKEAELVNARRIWYWDGAASLSQLAVDGTSKPENCKFPCKVESVILTEVIEIIPITEKAKASIDEVPVWEQ